MKLPCDKCGRWVPLFLVRIVDGWMICSRHTCHRYATTHPFRLPSPPDAG